MPEPDDRGLQFFRVMQIWASMQKVSGDHIPYHARTYDDSETAQMWNNLT